MRIYRDISEVVNDKDTVLTIGTFDGIHIGHRQILDTVIDKARTINGRNFVITFDPHPRSIISTDYNLKLLTTLPEKINLFETFGIENLLIINFSKAFSQLTSEEFFEKYIINGVGLKEIVIGFDHHFGKGRSGDENTLRYLGERYDFKLTRLDAFEHKGTIISSTKIRTALLEGNVSSAADLLGRYYEITGEVVKGDMRGRKLGFPTANINNDDDNKLLPALGIYAVKIELKGKYYNALMNIGKRPTFYDAGKTVVEAYIYDFNDDIYGEKVKVEFIQRIRDEKKFNSADELITQMNIDKETGLKIFKKIN